MENIQKEQVKKAGAIILHPADSTKIALIYRARRKDWSFPKGHIENAETPLVACMREVKEETGLDIEILIQLPDYKYTNKVDDNIVTSMFLARSKGGDFMVEYPEDKIEWVDIHEVPNLLTYDNLKEYYRSILPIIER